MPDMKENYVLIEKMDRQPISNRRNVSKVMKQKRQECPERITNEYGNQLRMNRSIRAERSFADVKEDMNFRRYLYRGKKNAPVQSILLAIGRNFNKLFTGHQTDVNLRCLQLRGSFDKLVIE